MQSSIQHPVEATVALSFLCLLVDAVKAMYEKEIPLIQNEIDPKHFYDGSFEYQHFDRLGGVLSHLRKVHRTDIVQQLGTERAQEVLDDQRALVRGGELGIFCRKL